MIPLRRLLRLRRRADRLDGRNAPHRTHRFHGGIHHLLHLRLRHRRFHARIAMAPGREQHPYTKHPWRRAAPRRRLRRKTPLTTNRWTPGISVTESTKDTESRMGGPSSTLAASPETPADVEIGPPLNVRPAKARISRSSDRLANRWVEIYPTERIS